MIGIFQIRGQPLLDIIRHGKELSRPALDSVQELTQPWIDLQYNKESSAIRNPRTNTTRTLTFGYWEGSVAFYVPLAAYEDAKLDIRSPASWPTQRQRTYRRRKIQLTRYRNTIEHHRRTTILQRLVEGVGSVQHHQIIGVVFLHEFEMQFPFAQVPPLRKPSYYTFERSE